ncbi:hypothetical protein ACOME3_009680 [Neoechinorhynchus agilis]
MNRQLACPNSSSTEGGLEILRQDWSIEPQSSWESNTTPLQNAAQSRYWNPGPDADRQPLVDSMTNQISKRISDDDGDNNVFYNRSINSKWVQPTGWPDSSKNCNIGRTNTDDKADFDAIKGTNIWRNTAYQNENINRWKGCCKNRRRNNAGKRNQTKRRGWSAAAANEHSPENELMHTAEQSNQQEEISEWYNRSTVVRGRGGSQAVRNKRRPWHQDLQQTTIPLESPPSIGTVSSPLCNQNVEQWPTLSNSTTPPGPPIIPSVTSPAPSLLVQAEDPKEMSVRPSLRRSQPRWTPSVTSGPFSNVPSTNFGELMRTSVVSESVATAAAAAAAAYTAFLSQLGQEGRRNERSSLLAATMIGNSIGNAHFNSMAADAAAAAAAAAAVVTTATASVAVATNSSRLYKPEVVSQQQQQIPSAYQAGLQSLRYRPHEQQSRSILNQQTLNPDDKYTIQQYGIAVRSGLLPDHLLLHRLPVSILKRIRELFAYQFRLIGTNIELNRVAYTFLSRMHHGQNILNDRVFAEETSHHINDLKQVIHSLKQHILSISQHITLTFNQFRRDQATAINQTIASPQQTDHCALGHRHQRYNDNTKRDILLSSFKPLPTVPLRASHTQRTMNNNSLQASPTTDTLLSSIGYRAPDAMSPITSPSLGVNTSPTNTNLHSTLSDGTMSIDQIYPTLPLTYVSSINPAIFNSVEDYGRSSRDW